MARTKGAVNRPRLMGVKISDLLKIFNPDAVINVSTEYSSMFDITKPTPAPAVSVATPKPAEPQVKVTNLANFSVKPL